MSTTTVTNSQSGTNVSEIAAGIYRISTPVPPTAIPGGFTFNQFLIVDDEPLLFHTGLRKMFPLVREAVAHVLGDVARPRHVGFSHYRDVAFDVRVHRKGGRPPTLSTYLIPHLFAV